MSRLLSEDRMNDPILTHVRDDFVRISLGGSVGQALTQIQQSRTQGRYLYFYVVDEAGRLEGVVSTRSLLLSRPDTPVADIMDRRIVTLRDTASLLDACEAFLLHRLLALPVVDKEGHIVGVVDVDVYTSELVDLAHREESKDVFQLIGVHLARVQHASILHAFRLRFPWLLCNIGGGLACVAIGASFEGVLEKAIVLAMFIPVVLTVAESVSIQSLTLAIQAHEPRTTGWAHTFWLARREAAVAGLLGIACGALVGLVACFWRQHLALAVSILASVALAVVTAALFGLLVPLVLRTARRDPKVASGPIALAMTDVATLIYYFTCASWLLA